MVACIVAAVALNVVDYKRVSVVLQSLHHLVECMPPSVLETIVSNSIYFMIMFIKTCIFNKYITIINEVIYIFEYDTYLI